jgi:hypothetical protein
LQDNDNFNNDSAAYNMSTATISIDTMINEASSFQTLLADIHGYKIESVNDRAQPIVIPITNTLEVPDVPQAQPTTNIDTNTTDGNTTDGGGGGLPTP